MKHLVDLDEAALQAAKDQLGTDTIKATVNAALRRAAGADTTATMLSALDSLGSIDFADREEAWR
jgi:Arc/MetJ family transcription regulator